MTAAAIVLNLIRKDWLRTRWLLVLVCAALGIAIIVSLPGVRSATCKLPDYCNTAPILVQFVCGLIATIFVSSIVQDDSPTSADSFWRAQPVSARALFFGKMCYAFLLVIMLALLAQVISMLANGIPLSGAGTSVAATVYWVASLSIFSVLIASVTNGTQAFLLAVTGLGVLRMLKITAAWEDLGIQIPRLSHPISVKAGWWIIFAIGIAAWSYLARLHRQRVRVGSVIFASCALAVAWDSGDAIGLQFFTSDAVAPDVSLPAVTSSVLERDSGYTLRLATTAPPLSARYLLACGDISLEYSNGEVVPVWPWRCGRNSWSGLQPDSADPTLVSSVFYLGFRTPRSTAKNVHATSLHFYGFLEMLTSAPAVTLSATSGAELDVDGTRFTVITSDSTSAGRALHLVYLDILAANKDFLRGQPGKLPQFANASFPIIEDGFVPLASRTFRFGIVDGEGLQRQEFKLPPLTNNYSSFSAALPSLPVSRDRLQLNPGCEPSCAAEWWKGKRISITRWKHVSYAPVQAELPLLKR